MKQCTSKMMRILAIILLGLFNPLPVSGAQSHQSQPEVLSESGATACRNVTMLIPWMLGSGHPLLPYEGLHNDLGKLVTLQSRERGAVSLFFSNAAVMTYTLNSLFSFIMASHGPQQQMPFSTAQPDKCKAENVATTGARSLRCWCVIHLGQAGST